MARRAVGSADLIVYDPGKFYKVDTDAQGAYQRTWGVQYTAKELHTSAVIQLENQGQRLSTAISPHTALHPLDLAYSHGVLGRHSVDKLETISYLGDPINAYCCTMAVPANTTKINLSNFNVSGNGTANWTDGARRPDGGWPVMYNDSEVPSSGTYEPGVSGYNNTYDVLTSKFSLPPNPMFAISLWLGEPPKLVGYSPETWITFGSGFGWSYRIIIEGRGKISTYAKWPNDGAWRPLNEARGGSLRNNNPKADKRTKLSLLTVMVTHTGLALSNDGFTQNIMYWDRPRREGTEGEPDGVPWIVTQSPISFQSNLGKWGVQLFPLYPVLNGTGDGSWPTMFGPVHGVGFDWWQEALIQPNFLFEKLRGQHTSTLTGEPNAIGKLWAGCTENPLTPQSLATSKNNQIQPIIELYPTEYTYEGLGFSFWTTPLLTAFHAAQNVPVSGQIGPEKDTSKDEDGLIAVSIESELSKPAVKTKIVVDNQRHEWTDALLDNETRRVNLIGRWSDGKASPTYSDASPIFRGVVQEYSTQLGNNRVDASLYDDLAVLTKATVDGRLAVSGAREKVSDYLAYILTGLGIPLSQLDLEDIPDTGDFHFPGPGRLNESPFGKLLWTPEIGRTWERFVKDILYYSANAGMWVDHTESPDSTKHPKIMTGCKWCHAQRIRNPAPGSEHLDYLQHLHGGPAAPGCILNDIVRTGTPDGVDFPLYTSASNRTTATDVNLKYAIVSLDRQAIKTTEVTFNKIIVKGPKPRRKGSSDQIIHEVFHWDSINGQAGVRGALGYLKEKTIERDWIVANSIAERIMTHETGEAFLRNEFVEVTIPFLPEAIPSKVFSVHGGEREGLVGPLGWPKYRIIKMSHNLFKQAAKCQTKLLGWKIGTTIL